LCIKVLITKARRKMYSSKKQVACVRCGVYLTIGADPGSSDGL
jgi:hypothetical protein